MKAVFLDRDGVVNIDKSYLYKIEDFEFLDNVLEACQHFQSLGYLLVIVTNQSGIGRGYYTESDFEKLTAWMLEKFQEAHIHIHAVYHCPHAPDTGCDCRKPLPGMFLQAHKEHHIDLKNSWMIGDKESDIEAANAAGITQTIRLAAPNTKEKITSKASYVLGTIKEAMDIIDS